MRQEVTFTSSRSPGDSRLVIGGCSLWLTSRSCKDFCVGKCGLAENGRRLFGGKTTSQGVASGVQCVGARVFVTRIMENNCSGEAD